MVFAMTIIPGNGIRGRSAKSAVMMLCITENAWLVGRIMPKKIKGEGR